MQQQRQEQESESGRRHVPWWRDEVPESTLPPVEGTAPTEVSLPASSEQLSAPETDQMAAHHDLWEELEAEAQRRALLANTETILPLNLVAFTRRQNRLFIGVFLIDCLAKTASLIHAVTILTSLHTGTVIENISPLSEFIMYVMLYWLLFAFFVFAAREIEKRQSSAHITLRDTGMEVALADDICIPLLWDEIATIRNYSVFGTRYIGIQPKNTQSVAQRVKGRARAMLIIGDALGVPMRQLGQFRPPISIPVSALPMKPEAFLAQVATLRTRL